MYLSLKKRYYFSRIVFVLLAVGATVAFSKAPTLSQVVTCNGPKPEFKDAVEAATRNRVGSGYVSFKKQKCSSNVKPI